MELELTEYDFRHVKKQDLLEYVQSFNPNITQGKRTMLIKEIINHCNQDTKNRQRMLSTMPFLRLLTLTKQQIEDILQCSPAERRRWVAESRFPFKSYTYTIYDKPYTAEFLDRYFIEHVSEEEVAKWRAEYEEQKNQHKLIAVQKAQMTKQLAQNKLKYKLRRDFKKEYPKMITDIFKSSNVHHQNCMELAYWGHLLYKQLFNECLKTIEPKYRYNYNYGTKQLSKYIELLLSVMDILVMFPWTSVSLLKPKNSCATTYIGLCPQHRSAYFPKVMSSSPAWMGREFDVYEQHSNVFDACPSCQIYKDENYYSQYLITIKNDNASFEFYIPHIQYRFRSQYKENDINIINNATICENVTPLSTEEQLLFDIDMVTTNIKKCMKKFDIVKKMLL